MENARQKILENVINEAVETTIEKVNSKRQEWYNEIKMAKVEQNITKIEYKKKRKQCNRIIRKCKLN